MEYLEPVFSPKDVISHGDIYNLFPNFLLSTYKIQLIVQIPTDPSVGDLVLYAYTLYFLLQ